MRRLGVIANSTAGQSTVSRTSGLAGELAGNFVSVANAVARSGAETARAAHFWSTVLAIWGRYKVTQTRAHIAALRGNAKEAQRLWKRRHNVEAETMWRLCVGMRGFYVKAGQLIALQAFVPLVIRQRLAQLQDNMPAMDAFSARSAIDIELKQLGTSFSAVFSSIDLDSVLGSASIAQVHRGVLRNTGEDVAVKIQYPNGERRMARDLSNFRFLAAMLQRTEFKFDLVSPVHELARQISFEFDFVREAVAMDEIRKNLMHIRGITIPRSHFGFTTRRLLVMEFIHGTPLSQLEGATATLSLRNRKRVARAVLQKMARGYGEMILTHGFFQADCHPGNVLVTNRRIDIALLDFGQTKRFQFDLRIRFARLIDAIDRRDGLAVDYGMRALGIGMSPVSGSDTSPGPRSSKLGRSLSGAEMLAYTMFDTADVDGVSNNPFADNSALKHVAIDRFPPDLFFLLRTVQIMKGICTATGNEDFSIASRWAPIARRALATMPRHLPK